MSTEGNANNYIELRGSLSLPEAIHGKSAYEIAVMNGFEGTEAEWLESLKGGITEITLEHSDEYQSQYRIHFIDGSTFDYTVKNGNSITVTGVEGAVGDEGINIVRFSDGSCLMVQNGSKGDKGESVTITKVIMSTADGGENSVTFSDGTTLNVKNGSKGSVGKSAYQYAVEGGYAGSEEDFKKECANFLETGILPYNPYRTIHVGNNLFNSANLTLGEGWSYSDGVLTHAASATESASLTFNGVDGADYLLEFTTNYTANEFVKIAIGNGYPEMAYNGTGEIIMPMKCWGNPTLTITPYVLSGSPVAFTMSNIRLRKIQDEGDEVSLFIRAIVTDQNLENYGYRNIILGYDTFKNATGATRTIAIGNSCLSALKGGHRNIAIGGHVLKMLEGGENNIGIGADVGIYVKEGEDNIAMGRAALGQGDNLLRNVAIGTNALNGVAGSTAKDNVGVGYNAMYRTTGQGNVAIGSQAGGNNKAGNSNVMIGKYSSVMGDSANQNTLIGAGTLTESNIYGSTAIGANAKATKPNQMMLGASNVTEVVFCGNKKINFNTDGTVTWETIS